MTIRLPINSSWTQPNNSDKFGSIWYTKNINMDEEGYIKLSPRTITIMNENIDNDFGLPLAIGKFSNGEYQVATNSNANWEIDIDEAHVDRTEDSGASNPTLNSNSHGLWFSGLWHASTDTAVLSRPASGGAAQAWTSRVTGLTSGKRHYLAVFKNRNSLTVSDGNVLKQYDNVYSNTVNLTIPSDFEIVGQAYNNNRMGIITELSDNGVEGQDQESMFFTWEGATTEASGGWAIGADAAVAIVPYKSSFVILTSAGQLLYFNGGGFEILANFPFYNQDKIWNTSYSYMFTDGDVIYINISSELAQFGRRQEQYLINFPSGVWCFDPKVGLYHRWSPSLSIASVHFVAIAGVDTSTNIFTTTAGVYGLETLPDTGNIVRISQGNNNMPDEGKDYYIIKLSATTFKLANTKEEALAGSEIQVSTISDDIYMWSYDLKDYGDTLHTRTGVIALTGDQNRVYTDIIFGTSISDPTDLISIESLCVAVPFLENRGYFVTPKIFSSQIEDNANKLIVKFKPLKETDSIIVKIREKDVLGLPITSSGLGATWTGDSEFFTSQDLSEAKEYLDEGGELEIEFLAGVGGGVSSKITSISGTGPYAVELEDEVLGAEDGLKSEFAIYNWRALKTITSQENNLGYSDVIVGFPASWMQFKFELRGSDVTIEEISIHNSVNKQ